MAKKNRPQRPEGPKTGNEFIEDARGKGAVVEDAAMKKGVKFTSIETPAGKMYIAPGNQPLDPRTRKNYRHWFRLLGLLLLLAFIARVLYVNLVLLD